MQGWKRKEAGTTDPVACQAEPGSLRRIYRTGAPRKIPPAIAQYLNN